MNQQHYNRIPLALFLLILSLLAWLSISDPSQAQEPPAVSPPDKLSQSDLNVDNDSPTMAALLQQVKLSRPDNQQNTKFGSSIAISGDTVFIGAFFDDEKGENAGAVYIYQKPEEGWGSKDGFIDKLTISNGGNSWFGVSVAVSGDTLVVGAHGANAINGAAYIFEKPVNGSWGNATEVAKLTTSDSKIGDFFGARIAISDDTVVIGAPGNSHNQAGIAGTVYIYQKPTNGWSTTSTFTAKLLPSNSQADDGFGVSTAISGDTVVIGAALSQRKDTVYIFEKPVGGWANMITETAKLSLANLNQSVFFGGKVAINGDTVVVGDHGYNLNEGAAYIFEKPVGGWANTITETAKLIPSHNNSFTFGIEVAINGDTVIIGAPWVTYPDNSKGRAYIYQKPLNGWSSTITETTQLAPSDLENHAHFGESIAISDDTVVIGASWMDNEAGAVYVYPNLLLASEITVSGNNNEITSGNTTPTLTDHTDFGSVNVSGGTVQRTFTISNTGDAPLTVGTLSLSGANAADFSVIQPPTSSIVPNGSSTFTVEFVPSSTGIRTATVSITNNDINENPYTFAIQGTGTATAANASVYLPLISKP